VALRPRKKEPHAIIPYLEVENRDGCQVGGWGVGLGRSRRGNGGGGGVGRGAQKRSSRPTANNFGEGRIQKEKTSGQIHYQIEDEDKHSQEHVCNKITFSSMERGGESFPEPNVAMG